MPAPAPTPQTFVEADPTTREVRDLKNTISALRQSVEEARAAADQRVQDAVAASNYEISQLKATTAALRQALEEERAERDAKVREALRGASDEIAQLRAAVAALRESLEKGGK
jgi:predicted  nucleic acid-binding Zn-ribbon protein